MTNKQLAALYLELSAMYHDELFGINSKDLPITADVEERIEDSCLTAEDIAHLEPIFAYGHVDVHEHLRAKKKKRFIWF
ncbi:hypothetical protein WN093_14750 [Gammaproteobacteria bacterium AS21]